MQKCSGGEGHEGSEPHDQCRLQVATALLHNPYDSTAWYVSAMCNLQANDLPLVERDLRRMMDLEKGSAAGHALLMRMRAALVMK